ncbi:hypothetical protein RDWZM_000221 [Blomia tropicalis]|uniref:Uncharacterized protein n=1 Tax=Blomia tropicalis TaxID=40697 RepID=A0A9Q0RPE6_BLOTA|nr:hypothetical protein RDWZM_000221 [Blomia tropicalis]
MSTQEINSENLLEQIMSKVSNDHIFKIFENKSNETIINDNEQNDIENEEGLTDEAFQEILNTLYTKVIISSKPKITDIETTKYLKIEEVSKLKSGDVNLYGVVMAYREDRNKLTLMDETFPTKYDIVFLKGYDPRQTLDEYSLYIGQKSKDVNGKVPIRTGDIIRIENLCLPENIAANVVIFQPFKFDPFSPIYISNSTNPPPLFCKGDLDRVKQLIEWNNEQLLSFKLEMQNKKQSFLNCAFQFLAIISNNENKSTIVVWNGQDHSHLATYKAGLYSILEYSLQQCVQCDEPIYTTEYLRYLCESRKIIYIDVYGFHSVLAKKLKPLDMIVLYNIKVENDKPVQCYRYTFQESFEFGRDIRSVDEESLLGKKLLKNIKQHYNNWLKSKS